MFTSRYMPCPRCGASVERSALNVHRCDPSRLVEHTMFLMRDQVVSCEKEFRDHLTTPLGRFEAWLAARDVRSTAR